MPLAVSRDVIRAQWEAFVARACRQRMTNSDERSAQRAFLASRPAHATAHWLASSRSTQWAGATTPVARVVAMLAEGRSASSVAREAHIRLLPEWLAYVEGVRRHPAVYHRFGFAAHEAELLAPGEFTSRVFENANLANIVDNQLWSTTAGDLRPPRFICDLRDAVLRPHPRLTTTAADLHHDQAERVEERLAHTRSVIDAQLAACQDQWRDESDEYEGMRLRIESLIQRARIPTMLEHASQSLEEVRRAAVHTSVVRDLEFHSREFAVRMVAFLRGMLDILPAAENVPIDADRLERFLKPHVDEASRLRSMQLTHPVTTDAVPPGVEAERRQTLVDTYMHACVAECTKVAAAKDAMAALRVGVEDVPVCAAEVRYLCDVLLVGEEICENMIRMTDRGLDAPPSHQYNAHMERAFAMDLTSAQAAVRALVSHNADGAPRRDANRRALAEMARAYTQPGWRLVQSSHVRRLLEMDDRLVAHNNIDSVRVETADGPVTFQGALESYIDGLRGTLVPACEALLAAHQLRRPYIQAKLVLDAGDTQLYTDWYVDACTDYKKQLGEAIGAERSDTLEPALRLVQSRHDTHKFSEFVHAMFSLFRASLEMNYV